ncbi:MAG TPA: nucleotide sugar dehydrogenase, partial [Methanophagales archaeon]|nr:nucleotide sugar dehydrogenase [Methanophagales archaeon]
VILAGRAINDYMPKHVAEMAIKGLNEVGKVIKGSKVLIMGLTYKENVPDTRESPVREMLKELKEFGVEIHGYDPLLNKEEIEEFGVKALGNLDVQMDCVILAVAHDEFKKINLKDMKELMNNAPVLIDVRGMFDGEEAKRKEFYYKTL